ncbi:BLUF domain-containing protein [Asticcacaulis sp. AC466]|uniref:BLUF domain-containing protein n=1 Tax=Asticcacaulis sp. AC466 TaxID=1282362 RepID=UPI003510481C
MRCMSQSGLNALSIFWRPRWLLTPSSSRNAMFQLIYHSRYTISTSGLNTIRNILSASETNNYRNGVTGFLIFDKSSFVQVLEGERGMVEDTYLRICNDPRLSGMGYGGLHRIAGSERNLRPSWHDWRAGGIEPDSGSGHWPCPGPRRFRAVASGEAHPRPVR